ncbi:MAG: putative lipid II flippase FtsW [Bacillota bacterium]|jgi:cell division protein FtsW
MKIKKTKSDFWLFLIVLVLVAIGLVMVLSSSQYFAQHKPYEDSFYFLKRQLFNAAVGFVGMYIASKIPYRKYNKYANIILIIGIVITALIFIPGVGDDANGSVRWIDLGFVRFQPSDITKLCLVVFLAKILAERRTVMTSFVRDFLPLLGLVGIVCAEIAAKDLGTAIVLAAAVLCMFIAGRVPGKYIGATIGAGMAGVAGMIAVAPYRMERITGFLDPWSDPLGNGYQTIQSLLAVGSGGLLGVGLGKGGAKWYYLPERHTDFIYAVLVEEGGFIFGAVVLLLFLLLLWRGITIALRTKDGFGSLLAVGITLMIVIQALVNIAICLGLMPVTGITLPFISYGGTSLVISLASVGVLLNISKYADMNK